MTTKRRYTGAVDRRLLLVAAVALLAAVALALVPFERGLDATGRNGIPVDIDLSVACPAPIIGSFEADSAGWFNYGSDGVAAGGGLCRTSSRWRLAGSFVLAVAGAAALRRGLPSAAAIGEA